MGTKKQDAMILALAGAARNLEMLPHAFTAAAGGRRPGMPNALCISCSLQHLVHNSSQRVVTDDADARPESAHTRPQLAAQEAMSCRGSFRLDALCGAISTMLMVNRPLL